MKENMGLPGFSLFVSNRGSSPSQGDVIATRPQAHLNVKKNYVLKILLI